MNPQTLRLLGFVAASDLLVGLVVAGIGIAADIQGLQLGGLALLLAGGAMLAWVVTQRNKPTTL